MVQKSALPHFTMEMQPEIANSGDVNGLNDATAPQLPVRKSSVDSSGSGELFYAEGNETRQLQLPSLSIESSEVMPSAEPAFPRRLFDRRGYDWLININIALFVVCFMVLNLYSWKIGLSMLVFAGLSLHTLDAISSPSSANPKRFMLLSRRMGRNRPVLLCLGDSLTHGKCSASFTHRIPKMICTKLSMTLPPKHDLAFQDPVWVVNAAQIGITSYTVLEERLELILKSCTQPDYALVMIGTNDARAMYRTSWAKQVVKVNRLPQVPSLSNFETNLRAILEKLEDHSPATQIAVATLPPMGENLQARSNSLIQNMNEVIESLVAEKPQRRTLLPVFARMVDHIERKSTDKSVSVDWFLPVAAVQNLLYQNFYPWSTGIDCRLPWAMWSCPMDCT
jgi:lysophospholipase L1-like esterase